MKRHSLHCSEQQFHETSQYENFNRVLLRATVCRISTNGSVYLIDAELLDFKEPSDDSAYPHTLDEIRDIKLNLQRILKKRGRWES